MYPSLNPLHNFPQFSLLLKQITRSLKKFETKPFWVISGIGLTLLFPVTRVYATAGGGGGGGAYHGGGSHGSDSGSEVIDVALELLWDILFRIPFPYNILIIAILLVLIYYVTENISTSINAASRLNQIPSFQKTKNKTVKLPEEFVTLNPGFSQAEFVDKVKTAFFAIQNAWMLQDMAGVRRWVSDGIWQRFNTQFMMMQALGQRNTISELNIKQIFIERVQLDGYYATIDVGIHFTAYDHFVTERHPELNQTGFLENLEYWSFIRKLGATQGDLYHSNHCPACGNEYPETLGEVARCGSCGVISTLGEYDWILSEITQVNDYLNDLGKQDERGVISSRIRAALSQNTDFAVQWLEDKASNAYFQIMAARTSLKPEKMRRFVTDSLFEHLSQEIQREQPYWYNRLYLNNVTLFDYFQEDSRDNLVLSLKYSAQRLLKDKDSLLLVDRAVYTYRQVMILSRDVGAGLPKGSLYAHSCPNCGGPIPDTLEIHCAYCGSVLNSTNHEWIVSDILDEDAYQTRRLAAAIPYANGLSVENLDPLFDLRDYALNNLLSIIMADGRSTELEMAFAQQVSQKMGYDKSKLQTLFDLAKYSKLSLRIPPSRNQAEKVFMLMKKAAAVDGAVGREENALLQDMQQRIRLMK